MSRSHWSRKNNMKDTFEFVGMVAAMLALLTLTFMFSLVGSIVVYWGWNSVIPSIFGLPYITWMQALWLTIICNILFEPSLPTKSDITNAVKDALKDR